MKSQHAPIRQAILAVTFLFALSASAQEKQDALNVLFIGNSYTYGENLPHLVSILSEGTDTPLITRKSTAGGASLSQHWNGERGLKSKEMIETGNYDIVVIQDYSKSAMETPDSLAEYAEKFCALAKEHGAQPYLYVTWAREKLPQMQKEIDKQYLKAAKKNKATPVMVGDAWALAMHYRPDIHLYSSDGSHSSETGTYLTASVFVKTICGSLPEKVGGPLMILDERGESVVLMYMDPLDASFCKEVAEEIVTSGK